MSAWARDAPFAVVLMIFMLKIASPGISESRLPSARGVYLLHYLKLAVDHLAAIGRAESPPNRERNRVADESATPVAHRGVHAAGMHTAGGVKDLVQGVQALPDVSRITVAAGNPVQGPDAPGTPSAGSHQRVESGVGSLGL